MATEQDPIKTTDGTQADQQQVKPDQAKPEAKAADQQQAKPEAKAADKGDPKADEKKRDEGDSGDMPEPDEKGFVTMRFPLFMKRLARMTRREMKKQFGTDDMEAIVKEREELKALRTEKEERERKDRTEKENLEADLKKEKARADLAEEKANAAEERVIVREADRDLEKVAGGIFDDEYADYALDKLAAHMRKHPREVTKAKHAEAWLKEFAEKHPRMAKGYEAKKADDAEDKAEEKKAEVKKVPLTTDKVKRPEAKGKTPEAKNVMDMSRAEATAYAKSQGYNLP